jgi:hypothetical protein
MIKSLRVSNEHLSLQLDVGTPGEVVMPGIRITSIRDKQVSHEYFSVPSCVFEYSVNNGPVRNASRDLEITKDEEVQPGRVIEVDAKAPADHLLFKVQLAVDGARPAILLAIDVENQQDKPVFLRTVLPKLIGLRARGNHPFGTLGMVPIEIGSTVPLLPLYLNFELDPMQDGYNAGTMGMPYRGEAKRIGLPTSMNAMEVVDYFAPEGGGLFVADIEHDVRGGVAPIQLTLSILGVEGFWVAQIPPGGVVYAPRLAIGVHHYGDWHQAVDYYVSKHRGRPNWQFPKAPAWFRGQGSIYSPTGGGGGGVYLANTIENLPHGAVATTFGTLGPANDVGERFLEWPPMGPIPLTEAGLAPAGAPVAVAVRKNKDEDLFVVNDVGALAWTYERDNGSWKFPTTPITPHHLAPPGARLAAVARHDEQIDVFVVGADGALWTIYGPATDVNSWTAVPLSAPGLSMPGAGVAAITRDRKHVDVFVLDTNGALRWTYERDNGAWLLAPQQITSSGLSTAGGNLAALARNFDQTDVFLVDADGKITTIYKTTRRDDGRWETTRLGQPVAGGGGGGIAAIAREGRHEDVFTIGISERVYHTAMRNNGAWSNPVPIAAISESNSKAPPRSEKFASEGAPITAVAHPLETDLFFIDHSGRMVRLFQERALLEFNAKPWREMDNPGPTIAGFSTPGGATAAVLRGGQEDVFLVTKGRIRSFRELPKFLEEATSLGTDVLYLWDYWEGLLDKPDDHAPGTQPLHPPYFNKGDYIPRRDLGGEDALREGISRVHDAGGKVILYVEPFIIFKDSLVARFRPDPNFKTHGEYLAGRYPAKAPLSVIANDEERAEPKEWEVWKYCHTMVPKFSRWQDYVEQVVTRLVNDYGADGIFLDSFGWQMNWPMSVRYLGPAGEEPHDYWPLEYAQGVLELADRVRSAIGPHRVLLVETPSGPIRHHCHGGTTADFGFHVGARLSNQSRIVASPSRYGLPKVRYFGNGGSGEYSLNKLHQVYAAGHDLALCYQHISDGDEDHIRELVRIRRLYADALIHGEQLYQLKTGSDDVVAYYYRDSRGSYDLITVVNTSPDIDHEVQLKLQPHHAGSVWTELLTGNQYTCTWNILNLHTVPAPKTDKTKDLLVLARGGPWLRGTRTGKEPLVAGRPWLEVSNAAQEGGM